MTELEGRGGVTKALFANFSVSKIFILQKYLLDCLNHIHIRQVPLQLSSEDTYQYKHDIQELMCVLSMLKNSENKWRKLA